MACCCEDIITATEIAVRDTIYAEFPDVKKDAITIYWNLKQKRAVVYDFNVNLAIVYNNKDLGDQRLHRVEKLSNSLVNQSESWVVPLDRCVLTAGTAQMCLRRCAVMKTLAASIKASADYEWSRLRTTKERTSCTTLSTLRTYLLAQVVYRLLETNGHHALVIWTDSSQLRMDVCCGNDVCDLRGLGHETTVELHSSVIEADAIDDRLLPTNVCSNCVYVVFPGGKCGCANLRGNKNKEESYKVLFQHGPVTGDFKRPDDFYSFKRMDVESAVIHRLESKQSEPVDHNQQLMIDNLVDLCVKFDILRCCVSSPVQLINVNVRGSSRGAFVMYNYARICSILHNFEKEVARCVYRPLPEDYEVDFTVLTRDEEWILVLCCASYPSVIRRILLKLVSPSVAFTSKPQIHLLLVYTERLVHNFSIYYNRIHILNEPATHLQNVIHARIWLLKVVKRTLESIFYILNVEPLKCM